MTRSQANLATQGNRPEKYDLTPTLIINSTEEEEKQLKQDIVTALKLSPHQEPMERGSVQ